jgi:hypothetical protein
VPLHAQRHVLHRGKRANYVSETVSVLWRRVNKIFHNVRHIYRKKKTNANESHDRLFHIKHSPNTKDKGIWRKCQSTLQEEKIPNAPDDTSCLAEHWSALHHASYKMIEWELPPPAKSAEATMSLPLTTQPPMKLFSMETSEELIIIGPVKTDSLCTASETNVRFARDLTTALRSPSLVEFASVDDDVLTASTFGKETLRGKDWLLFTGQR